MAIAARLKAGAHAGQNIEIRLTWKKLGFFRRLVSGDVDLDLGCYYRLADGSSMLIDALQFSSGGGARDVVSRQGCLTQPPYIWHTGNDPGTGRESSESLLVNAEHLDSIKSIVVYCYIYDGGKAKWDEVSVELSVIVPGQAPCVIPLGKVKTDKRFCSLAVINVEEGGVLSVEECIGFFDGHADCDSHFGWGFTYRER